MLEGDKVLLRAVEAADAERVQRWVNEPSAMGWISAAPMAVSRRGAETWLAMAGAGREQGGRVFAVETKDSRHVGLVQIHHINWVDRRATLSILVGEPDYVGRGYEEDALRVVMGFAFLVLNLNRLEARLPASDAILRKAYGAAGFREEGRLNQFLYYNGGYADALVLGALAQDFRASRPEERPEAAVEGLN